MDSKEESIRDRNGNQWTKGPVEERDRSETRKVKQRSASIMGTEFCLREQGVGDKRGKVPITVRQGEEFVDGEVWLGVGGKENVGDIVEAGEFHNMCNVGLGTTFKIQHRATGNVPTPQKMTSLKINLCTTVLRCQAVICPR